MGNSQAQRWQQRPGRLEPEVNDLRYKEISMLPESVLKMSLGEFLKALGQSAAPASGGSGNLPGQPPPPAETGPRLVTIRTLCQGRSWPTVSSFRWMLFREPPGLEACVHRVGRRVLVDEPAFWAWVKGQVEAPSAMTSFPEAAPRGSSTPHTPPSTRPAQGRGRGRPRRAV